MRRTKLISALSLAGIGVLLAANAVAGGYGRNSDNFVVQMQGFQEVPAVVSGGSGQCRIQINEAAGTIDYQVGFEDLEGSITQSHIHIGQPNVAGGISLWLCQTTGTPAPASVAAITPMCPGPMSGNFSGTLTAANVIGPTGQAVPVGDLGDVLNAIRAGKTYCNIHSTVVPGGEIRAQLVH
jgi:hypothetical protein